MPLFPRMPPRRRLPSAVEALGSGDVSVTADGRGGLMVRDGRPDAEWGRIASHVSANEYTAIRLDDGDTAYPDRDALTVRCWELTGRSDVAVDTLVRLEPNRAGEGFTFVAPPLAGDLTGSGTDNRIVRWDGTSALQDSQAILDDSGNLTAEGNITSQGDGGGGYFYANNTFVSQTRGELTAAYLRFYDFLFVDGDGVDYVQLSMSAPNPSTDRDELRMVATVGKNGLFVLNTPLTFGTSAPAYAIADSAGTLFTGLSGTLGPGAEATGGIITDLGTGSFVGTATPNTFTATQTVTPAATTGVPLIVQGLASQTANLTEWKDSGGSVLASVSAAGVLSAAEFDGLMDGGTW